MPVVSRDGVELFYSVQGAGPDLFFHTGGAGDGSMWRTAGYADRLAGYRHLMLDQRGHGRSSRPAELSQHRVEEYVADVVAVLDAESIETITFVGYSDGGHVGCALAALHPERVGALVIIGGVASPGDDPQERRQMAAEARRVGVGPIIDSMSLSEEEPAPAWFVRNLTSTDAEMFALELEGWAGAGSQAVFFPKISCPTLIVCGARDNIDGAAQLAAKALVDGRAVVIPGLGHLEIFWRSDVTGAAIAEFLST